MIHIRYNNIECEIPCLGPAIMRRSIGLLSSTTVEMEKLAKDLEKYGTVVSVSIDATQHSSVFAEKFPFSAKIDMIELNADKISELINMVTVNDALYESKTETDFKPYHSEMYDKFCKIADGISKKMNMPFPIDLDTPIQQMGIPSHMLTPIRAIKKESGEKKDKIEGRLFEMDFEDLE